MERSLNEKFLKIARSPSKYPLESKWIAPKGVTGIKYISYIGTTGYADSARNYVRSLVDSGTYVLLEAVRYNCEKSEPTMTTEDNILAVCLNNKHLKYDTVVIHSTPSSWAKIALAERAKNKNVKIYGLTVWETNKVYSEWMKTIDDCNLAGLIVPSEWNRQIFMNTAKSMRLDQFPPVHVCHHMLQDTIIDNPMEVYAREDLYGPKIRMAILSIGTFGPRKGIAETIEAYIKAFRGYRDVVLYVKTSAGAFNAANSEKIQMAVREIVKGQKKCPRIIIDAKLRSDEYIEQLVKHCDVYLALPNSEGVGLGACNASLKGKVIIMTGWGGQREYIKYANWIDYDLDVVKVPPDFVKWIRAPQRWAYPRIPHAVSSLRDVYNNFDEHRQRALGNRTAILERFSSKVIGKRLMSIVGLDDSPAIDDQSRNDPVSDSYPTLPRAVSLKKTITDDRSSSKKAKKASSTKKKDKERKKDKSSSKSHRTSEAHKKKKKGWDW